MFEARYYAIVSTDDLQTLLPEEFLSDFEHCRRSVDGTMAIVKWDAIDTVGLPMYAAIYNHSEIREVLKDPFWTDPNETPSKI